MFPVKEMIGQQARVVDGRYNDLYLSTLNGHAPVEAVFGEHLAEVREGGHAIGTIAVGTLGKFEYEQHLVGLVMGAAKAGHWVAVEKDASSSDTSLALEEITRRGFGHVANFEGKTRLFPSAKYAAHCQQVLDTTSPTSDAR